MPRHSRKNNPPPTTPDVPDIRGDEAAYEPDDAEPEYSTPIEPLLEPGEVILWQGQPDPSVHTGPAEYYLVPFSIVVLIVGISWALTLATAGWIFVVGGVYAVVGRFFWKAHRKRLTYYAVTDRRVVRLAGRKGKSQPYSEIPNIKLRLRKSGNGTIRFSDRPGFTVVYQNSGMDYVSLFGNPDEIAFYDIPDAQKVHDLVLDQVYRVKGLPPRQVDPEAAEE